MLVTEGGTPGRCRVLADAGAALVQWQPVLCQLSLYAEDGQRAQAIDDLTSWILAVATNPAMTAMAPRAGVEAFLDELTDCHSVSGRRLFGFARWALGLAEEMVRHRRSLAAPAEHGHNDEKLSLYWRFAADYFEEIEVTPKGRLFAEQRV